MISMNSLKKKSLISLPTQIMVKNFENYDNNQHCTVTRQTNSGGLLLIFAQFYFFLKQQFIFLISLQCRRKYALKHSYQTSDDVTSSIAVKLHRIESRLVFSCIRPQGQSTETRI